MLCPWSTKGVIPETISNLESLETAAPKSSEHRRGCGQQDLRRRHYCDKAPRAQLLFLGEKPRSWSVRTLRKEALPPHAVMKSLHYLRFPTFTRPLQPWP